MKKALMITMLALLTSIVHGQVTNGLTAKYSFNNGNANDEIGSNNGTVNGASLTTDRFGNSNKAYLFINGDNITLPDDPALKSPVMTVSLWVKIDSLTTSNVYTNYIYSIVNSTTNAYFATFTMSAYCFNNQYLSVSQNGPSQSIVGFSTSTFAASWDHYVMSIDNDSMIMYINGQKQASWYKGFASTFTSDLITIGQSGNTTYDGNLNGAVDDIRVYNRVLTQVDVDSLFNEPDPMTVGVHENVSIHNTAHFYPNPAANLVHFSGNFNIMLTDLSGKTVVQQYNTNQIDMTMLPAGMYFISFEDENGKFVQRSKLIKE